MDITQNSSWIWQNSTDMEKANYIISDYLSTIFATPNSHLTEWFGYYNYDTLNSDLNKILVNRADFEGIAITSNHRIEVGYYDLNSTEWHSLGFTDSFNWQQGAMLQWLPANNDRRVIYNFSEDNEYKSRILDIQNGNQKIIKFPIYCIHPSGDFALSLNYKRLYWCRAYHYQPIKDKIFDGNAPYEDGIYKVTFSNNTVELLIDIKDIISIDADDDFKEAKHWIEHIMISPDGSKFVFLHRFSYGNVMSYGTRLFVCDIDGKNLSIVKGWRNFGWSHFGWCTNNKFAIYTYIAPKIGRTNTKPGISTQSNLKSQIISQTKAIIRFLIPHKVLNRIIGKTSYYQFYEIEENNQTVLKKEFRNGYFTIDGHPSFTNDGKYMITDTYPDKKRVQRLLVYNVQTEKTLELARFKAPLSGNPASCDLHPKLSRDNKYVAVDTAHSGRHQLMLFKIEWAKIIDVIG